MCVYKLANVCAMSLPPLRGCERSRFAYPPTAYAMGYCLPPLRGCRLNVHQRG